MKYLLDTHALLWFLYDDPRLSAQAKDLIETADTVNASIVSLWEVAIKQHLGKLSIEHTPSGLAEACEKSDIGIMGIEPEQLDVLESLPDIHKDPFDRLLVAQALSVGMSLITADEKISLYEVDVAW